MDAEFKKRFLEYWSRYFPAAELPIGFYYSHSAEPKWTASIPKGHRRLIEDLAQTRKGKKVMWI